MDAEKLNVALADRLAANGELNDPAWRAALLAVPRHRFVPDVAWARPDDGPAYRIDRTGDPGGWLAAAYADHAIITQFDDGATAVGAGSGRYTSSLSAPGVVLDFLELLAPEPGHRVLEIGTGPGWTAGLLAHRLGDAGVTSVEIDPQVLATAAANLRALGRRPGLVLGDGAGGRAGGAPYDGVHVTCGVHTVPHAWVRQTRPGGVIVLPWMPRYAPGHQLRLTAGPAGTASGHFAGSATYMPLRGQRSAPAPRFTGDFRRRTAEIPPETIFRAAYGADVAIAGTLPDVHASVAADNGFEVWLWAGDSLAYGAGSHIAETGPRNLWNEVERAFGRWLEWGRPERSRFGMTVSPVGQHVWLDSPGNPLAKGHGPSG
ncbi:methyltransferase domain-containing protein [Nonomuraea candida]|uniref:methyltransferase domain-containing protein n=1 Tax=Nonomuraea candida TaxID=359159 RepID=UPI0005BE474B|nr:methyltransferase domain-containing protein [Nonomuraea candida]